MVDKCYLDAQLLLEDSWRLGAMVEASGFKPDFICAIWRGGVPIGIAVQSFLARFGTQSDHIAIRTASYEGIDDQQDHVRVFGMEYLIERVNFHQSLLIVDDVFDTGRSIEAVVEYLRCRRVETHLRIFVSPCLTINRRGTRQTVSLIIMSMRQRHGSSFHIL